MRKRSCKPKRSAKTYISGNGYRKYKSSGKSVHRAAAEKKLGRPLKPGEVVHHKNRNKQDNSFSNIVVFRSQEAHWNAHKQDAKKFCWKKSMTGK